MDIQIQSGGVISLQTIDDMLALHRRTIKNQPSPLILTYTEEQLSKLWAQEECIIFTVYQQEKLVSYASIFPTKHPLASQLIPWINFDFFQQDLRGLPWLVTTIHVRTNKHAPLYGSALIHAIKDWRDHHKIGILTLEYHTFYTGLVPLLIAKETARPDLLFPNYKIAEQLALAGQQGVHANPIWFVCLNEDHLNMLKDVFIIKLKESLKNCAIDDSWLTIQPTNFS